MTTPRSPNRSPTHREIDPARLARLGLDVEEVAEEGPLTPDRLLALAAEQGKEPSQYYAAIALATELELPSAPVTAVFCVGTCQQWGALDCVDRAASEYERRPGRFAIAVRSCLDRCEHAPVCEIRSPAGAVVLAPATPAAVAEALAALADG
jgi:hypothetical protein